MDRKRILLVEDHADGRHVLTRLLKGSGYDVVAVGTGAEALAAVAAGPFDLAVLDYHLPDMTGVELLARARARSSAALPAIAATGSLAEPELSRMTGVGFARVVRKPFAFPDLLAAIASAIGGRDAPSSGAP